MFSEMSLPRNKNMTRLETYHQGIILYTMTHALTW